MIFDFLIIQFKFIIHIFNHCHFRNYNYYQTNLLFIFILEFEKSILFLLNFILLIFL